MFRRVRARGRARHARPALLQTSAPRQCNHARRDTYKLFEVRGRVDHALRRIVRVCARAHGNCSVESVGLRRIRWSVLSIRCASHTCTRAPWLAGLTISSVSGDRMSLMASSFTSFSCASSSICGESATAHGAACGATYFGVVCPDGAIAIYWGRIDCRGIRARRREVVRCVAGPRRTHQHLLATKTVEVGTFLRNYGRVNWASR
jgi:hypothetical protein